MASNVPLTLQTMISYSTNPYFSIININGKSISQQQTVNAATPGYYWALVLSRTDLSVQANFCFQANNVVPAQLNPYIAQPGQYILVLTTIGLSSANLPTGAFYDFLLQEGSAAELKKLEQIYAAFNCGTWGRFGYSLVTVIDNSPGASFEFASITGWSMVSTLLLAPIQIGSQTLYTPIAIR